MALGFDGLYGQDAYSYLSQLHSIQSHTIQNEYYPPMYALMGSVLNFFLHNEGISLQCVSLLSWLGASFALYRILKKSRISSYTSLILLISFVWSPMLVRMSVLVMSDGLSAFLGIASVYFGIFSKNRFRFPAFFILAALAVLTRYTMAIVLLPTLLFVFWQLFREKSWRNWVHSLSGILLGLCLLWYNFAFLTNTKGSAQHNWLQLWSLGNFFSRDFSHVDGSLHYGLPNIVYVFSAIYNPKFFILFLPALFFIRKEDFQSLPQRILIVSFLVYAFFLAGIPFQNERFLLPAFPFVFILFFPSLDRLCSRLGKFSWVLALVLPIQVVLIGQLLRPVYERNSLERELAKELAPYQGVPLYSFDIDIALEGRGMQFDFRNLWKKEYPSFEENALVLFNAQKFEVHWKGKNPMINWEKLSRSDSLVLLRELDQGWKLYRIKKLPNNKNCVY